MKANNNNFSTLVASSLVISLLALAGCNKAETPATPPVATTPTPTPAPYTPPTADQLSQMVAPIALFPDKLVAQVLAGATYPDQITAANQWLGQNPTLKGDALQNAANLQPWDVSVKSLTAFPAVLAQMANNIQWTTALGEAYANDPNDVMNAIQTMRLRAQQAGNLKNSQQMRVTSNPRPAPPPGYADESGYSVIAPPSQTIVIESAQPDMVYVPHYNPAVVYGAPIPVYPSYAYNPGYSSGNLITTGIISFGIGILVGNAISHHDGWGWHSWGMNWGGRGPGSGPDYGGGNGWNRPAVTYNNSTYITKSTTIINRNNNSSHITNNFGGPNNNVPAVNNNASRPNFSGGAQNVHPQNFGTHTQPQNGPMTMPHFNAADTHQGARPAQTGPGPQHNTNTLHSAQTRDVPPHANNRGVERPQSETGQRLNSTGFQHSNGQQHTLSTENRQQNPVHTAPSPNTLRSTGGQQNEMHQQQHMERENRAVRSNPEPQVRPQMQQQQQQQQQFHPQVQQHSAQQQPRPEQSRPQPQPQHMQAPHPQAQQPHPQTQQHAQERPHPAKQEERKER
ncbi:DUF3300 domain-containing protein [Herminiimonas arsenitoxidans]|uniref:DUF3300 domain-containing protein n=1 Tax=Herminiimonas arsenitoxidans TaxID=1809410 RepID=UPI000970DA08|nr:DUF3300 domain-containing protein [Herminiimonas arsenitoxidans]